MSHLEYNSISVIVNSVPFQLPATVEAGQAATLRPTLDAYVVQCLYSKVWQLREAAILKVEMILPELEGHLADNLSSLWQVCVKSNMLCVIYIIYPVWQYVLMNDVCMCVCVCGLNCFYAPSGGELGM